MGVPVLPEDLTIDLEAQPTPELHPLDFEWYFQPESSTFIAEMLARVDGRLLCLGAPTVAAALSAMGRAVTLIDRNPLVSVRLGAECSDVRLKARDLSQPIDASEEYEAVFFDAPWYLEEEQFWLWQAARAVSPGGLIAFSLPPPLVRPSASSERGAILRACAELGTVEIIEMVLAYDTPLFEAEALVANGLPRLPRWRIADLVVVRQVQPRDVVPPAVRRAVERWDTWVIGSEVVKVRRLTRGTGDCLVIPIRQTRNWVLPTISRRDPRRPLIDLWTSRNRVAQVGNRLELVTALDELLGKKQSAGFSDRQRDLSALLSIAP